MAARSISNRSHSAIDDDEDSDESHQLGREVDMFLAVKRFKSGPGHLKGNNHKALNYGDRMMFRQGKILSLFAIHG